MITVEQACEIVLKEGGMRYVFDIDDVGRGYVISSENEFVTTTAAPIFVDKTTGEASFYVIVEHFDELEAAKKLPVPERFQCPDAVYKDGFLVYD